MEREGEGNVMKKQQSGDFSVFWVRFALLYDSENMLEIEKQNNQNGCQRNIGTKYHPLLAAECKRLRFDETYSFIFIYLDLLLRKYKKSGL